MQQNVTIEARGLTKVYNKKTLFKLTAKAAVQDLNFELFKGETLGLVGESGCGKTTTCRLLLGLLKPTLGEVRYTGNPRVQGVFQDAAGALNPRYKIGTAIQEVASFHFGREKAKERALELLDLVGLGRNYYEAFPQELSGGQQQRAGLGRSLAMEPDVLICDEPMSSLDISVQAQLLKVFRDLQSTKGVTYFFVSHDLRVIRYISHRVAVMYQGRILELGPTEDLFSQPYHPYTKALLISMPRMNTKIVLEKQSGVQSLYGNKSLWPQNKSGCPYSTTCPDCAEQCRREVPKMREVAPGHWLACFG